MLQTHSAGRELASRRFERAPEHWDVVRLRRVATSITQRGEGQGPQVALEDIESWTGQLVSSGAAYGAEGIAFHRGDVLFGKLRPNLAKVYEADRDGRAIGDFIVLRPGERLLSRFLKYVLLAPSLIDSVVAGTYGAKMPRTNWEDLGSHSTALPPLREQRQIVEFLDRETVRIDALVREQEHLVELLREKRHGLVRQVIRKGIESSAASRDSGIGWIGPIPEHWRVLPCRAFMSERVERNERGNDAQYLSLMANIGIIKYEDKGDVGNKKPEDLSRCKVVRRGDFVINSMNFGIGSFGQSDLEGVCSPVYVVLRPNEEVVLPRFALRIFQDREFQSLVQSYGNGILAHRAAVGWDDLKNVGCAIPPVEEQDQIVRALDRELGHYNDLLEKAEHAIRLLRERRSAIISAAVTGQIDVRHDGVAPPLEAAL